MEEVKKKDMNFFIRLYKAITNFDIYSKFAEEPVSKAIIYAIILILISSLVLTINYVGIFREKLSEGINYLNENVENISFTEGILSFNNNQYANYEGEDNLVPIVIVDTSESPNIEEYKKKVNLYDLGFIILRDKILMPTSVNGEFNTLAYSDYNIENITKEELLGLFNNSSTYVYMTIAIFIVEFIEFFINILLDAVMLALIGQLIGLTLRMKIKFSAAYKMGIYALSLPIILQVVYIIVNSRTGFVINSFLWLYMTISYIYMLVAILMIKTDFINTQKELIKIQLEQKKIHEEMIQKEKEEKQKESGKEKEEKDTKDEDKHDEEGLDEQTQE